jgi:hypothetical protein
VMCLGSPTISKLEDCSICLNVPCSISLFSGPSAALIYRRIRYLELIPGDAMEMC